MPFLALQYEEMFIKGTFCLFKPGEVFLEHCKKFPRFSNFNLLTQKNCKFWSVCTVFDRKWKNMENGKSTKRNLNFVKRRNGRLRLVQYKRMYILVILQEMPFLLFSIVLSILFFHKNRITLTSDLNLILNCVFSPVVFKSTEN